MCWPTRTTSRNVGKRLPAPPSRTGADDRRLGMGRRRGLSLEEAQRRFRRPYSLRGFHLLGHRVADASVTPISAWPESHPVNSDRRIDTNKRDKKARWERLPASLFRRCRGTDVPDTANPRRRSPGAERPPRSVHHPAEHRPASRTVAVELLRATVGSYGTGRRTHRRRSPLAGRPTAGGRTCRATGVRAASGFGRTEPPGGGPTERAGRTPATDGGSPVSRTAPRPAQPGARTPDARQFGAAYRDEDESAPESGAPSSVPEHLP